MKCNLKYRLAIFLAILLSLMTEHPAFANGSEKKSLFRTVDEIPGNCIAGEVREYSWSDLSLREQKKLAETLLRLSWIILSNCDGQPTRDEQQRIYSVCTGDSTRLAVNVQYICGNE